MMRSNHDQDRFKVFLDCLRADYCRVVRPSFASAYRRAAAVAAHKDREYPSLSAARRMMQSNIRQLEASKWLR